jgi:hypothetical protein
MVLARLVLHLVGASGPSELATMASMRWTLASPQQAVIEAWPAVVSAPRWRVECRSHPRAGELCARHLQPEETVPSSQRT